MALKASNKSMSKMVAAVVFSLALLLAAIPGATASKSKYRGVPLQRMLSVRTHTVDISGNLFRYAWHSEILGTDTDRILRFNRSSCKGLQFLGGQEFEQDGFSFYETDARPEVVVLVEGLSPQVWTVPLNSTAFSPPFKLKPGRAAVIKVHNTVNEGGSDVYLSGYGYCTTRSGKLK